ncbi:MAG TPA: RNA-binding protein [Chitinophagaceae bacterium]|jgi:RNA recognition motif-containing protein
MNLYVSNLSFQITEENLNEMFSKYGKVNSVKIILDRETQRSRGFAFVEMSSEAEGNEALSALNNKEVGGRTMNVAVAREKQDKGNNSFYQRRNDNKRW